MGFVLYTDGASRGNPGPAAFGVVLVDATGRIVQEFGQALGKATNNEAEYRGLLAGLELARSHGTQELEIRLDSALLVAQLRGEYKIRAANLKPLYEQARKMLRRFSKIEISYVPRELNSRADALANRALDEQAK